MGHDQVELAEVRAKIDAVTAVVTALSSAKSSAGAVRSVLDVVREHFDWFLRADR